MRDRCSIYINIHGPIETVEALEAVLEALESDGLYPDTQDDAEAELFYGIGAANPPQFHDYECNYGNIGIVKEVLQEHGISYSGAHDAGDSYAAMVFAYYPKEGYFENVDDGDGASVSLNALKQAMKERRKLDAVRSLIDAAERANGVNMPTFTVSEAVRKHLAGEE